MPDCAGDIQPLTACGACATQQTQTWAEHHKSIAEPPFTLVIGAGKRWGMRMRYSMVAAGMAVLAAQWFLALNLIIGAGPAAAAPDIAAAHARCAKVADDWINSESYKKAVGISFLFVGFAALNSDHDRKYKKHKCLVEAGIDPNAPDPNAASPKSPSEKGTRTASKSTPGRGGDCPSYMHSGMSCTDAAGRSCSQMKSGRQCQ